MSSRAMLSDLLAEMLDGVELRRLAVRLGVRVAELPEVGVSPVKLAFELVGLLDRQGCVGDALFEMLTEVMPGKAAQIAAVARACAAEPVAVAPTAEAARLVATLRVALLEGGTVADVEPGGGASVDVAVARMTGGTVLRLRREPAQ